jgi:glycopeptide antibiotics resistance protein
MPNPAHDAKRPPSSSGWSNRILLAAIAGILFLTLYPFRFSLHAHALLNSSPFLLGHGVKRPSALDFTLNVLLFIPFGFGLSPKLLQRNWSRAGSVVIAALAGAAFSYVIEFVQIYVPMRDSGWDDIFSNTIGSVLGALVFAGIGRFVLRPLSEGKKILESLLTAGWAWLLLLAYLAAWFAVSIPLQRQTSLRNWEPNSYLLVGNDGSLKSPWEGKVFRLQIWDHALPDRLAQEMTSRGPADDLDPTPLADYDFSLPPPIHDQQRFLPDLSWSTRVASGQIAGHPAQVGNSWQASQGMATGLISALQKTNQFAVRVVCQPPKSAGPVGAIVSIAPSAGWENLSIWQQGANLIFVFRSPVTTSTWRTWPLNWSISGIFLADQVRDILINYDGANLSFFVDGKKDRHSLQLGPGVGLANLIHRAKLGEMQGYNYIYYVVVFFPAGCLLGIMARKIGPRQLVGPLLIGSLIAPLTLEMILADVSGRSFSYADVALSCILAIAATLWINADRLVAETDRVS